MATLLSSENGPKIVDSQSEATTSASNISQYSSPFPIRYFNPYKHAVNSLKVMNTYFNNQQLADVTLIVGTKRIPAHRLVLCAASDYFAKKFTSSLEEPIPNEILINNIDEKSLLDLVQYCYTGYIELRKDNLIPLFRGACLLKFKTVVGACCQFLAESLNPSNCLGEKMSADAQGYSCFSTIAQAYALKNFVEVIKNQEYLTLPAEGVAELLESEDINVPSEETVFHALMTWMQYDCENRSKDAGNLLSYIKLPLLSPAFIVTHIQSNEMLMSQKNVHTLIMEAFKYHLLPECRPVSQSGRALPRKSTIDALISIGPTSIDAFTLKDKAWKKLASIKPTLGQYFGAAVIHKNLVVVGGKINVQVNVASPCGDRRSSSETKNSAMSFNFLSKSWTNLPPMKTARHSFGVAVLAGSLYVIGGNDGQTALDSVERWDPTAQQWFYSAPLLRARSEVGVAVLDNKLYAVGGSGNELIYSSVEYYDPWTNKWTACAPMLKCRRGICSSIAVLNGYLYVLGGYGVSDYLDSVERYDPKTNTWSKVAPMSVAREHVGACTLNGRICAVGGIGNDEKVLTLVEVYDPGLNQWEQVSPLEVGKMGFCVAVKNSDISNGIP